jgi:hypothetical protein
MNICKISPRLATASNFHKRPLSHFPEPQGLLLIQPFTLAEKPTVGFFFSANMPNSGHDDDTSDGSERGQLACRYTGFQTRETGRQTKKLSQIKPN